jgi:hypothetical protein
MERPTREPLPLRRAQRCLARRRKSHLPCQAPAMPNGRCRIHGGLSPGAPKGKGNGMWRHGRYSKEHLEMRRAMRELIREARETLTKF